MVHKYKVFVYGSLKKGFYNHKLLEDAKFLGTGATLPQYTMLSLGSYPAILENGSTSIKGEIYEVALEELIMLDMLEGYNPKYPETSMYLCKEITLEDGTKVLCYIYNRVELVNSGEWKYEETESEVK